jgi:hypothetical protein
VAQFVMEAMHSKICRSVSDAIIYLCPVSIMATMACTTSASHFFIFVLLICSLDRYEAAVAHIICGFLFDYILGLFIYFYFLFLLLVPFRGARLYRKICSCKMVASTNKSTQYYSRKTTICTITAMRSSRLRCRIIAAAGIIIVFFHTLTTIIMILILQCAISPIY